MREAISHPKPHPPSRPSKQFYATENFERKDGLRKLGSLPTTASHGNLQFVSKRCVNLISELLEYREYVKENDHATDASRYSFRLQLKRSRFCMWLGVDALNMF